MHLVYCTRTRPTPQRRVNITVHYSEVAMKSNVSARYPTRRRKAVCEHSGLGDNSEACSEHEVEEGPEAARVADAASGEHHCVALVDQPKDPVMPAFIAPAPDSFLREKQVLVTVGLGRSSIWSFSNPRSRYYDPSFPKPVKLGARAVAWRASEIFAWVASRRAFK